MSKPKVSSEQRRLQAEQAELAKAQKKKISEDKLRLEQEQQAADAAAEKERQARISGQRAQRARRVGRGSLIATGSELGSSGSLG